MTKLDRVALYYRALAIIAMRQAGHSCRTIGEYFLISRERVRQICLRGAVPAQLTIPLQQGEPPCQTSAQPNDNPPSASAASASPSADQARHLAELLIKHAGYAEPQ